MTLKQLNYVVTVSETGNITEAAKKLFMSQPSLTSAIQELEKEYGIPIINKRVSVTPAALLCGASLALLADILSQLAGLPAGSTVALLGLPLLLPLLLSRSGVQQGN